LNFSFRDIILPVGVVRLNKLVFSFLIYGGVFYGVAFLVTRSFKFVARRLCLRGLLFFRKSSYAELSLSIRRFIRFGGAFLIEEVLVLSVVALLVIL